MEDFRVKWQLKILQENARLRAALEQIIELHKKIIVHYDHEEGFYYPSNYVMGMIEIARQALEVQE